MAHKSPMLTSAPSNVTICTLINVASVSNFKRYIDDGFIVWLGAQATILPFLHSLYEGTGLDITTFVSVSAVVMLDMVIFRSGRQLLTRCYQKPSNAYLYIPYSSEHAPFVWHGLVKGELIRYVKRCSLLKDFRTMKSLFAMRLRRRGFPFKLIRAAYKTVPFKMRSLYLQVKPSDVTPAMILPFVLTYSRNVFNLDLHRLFRENMGWLTRLPHFQNAKFTIAWRAAPKFSRTLVTYRYPRNTEVKESAQSLTLLLREAETFINSLVDEFIDS